MMQVRSLVFIFAASLLMAIISSSTLNVWIKAVLLAMILAPFIGLSFSTMEKVANNETLSINLSSITRVENRDVLAKFLVYLVLLSTLVIKLLSTSNFIAQVVAAMLIFGAPSSLIIIMMEKQLFSSFNPIKILAIIKIFSGAYLAIFLTWFGAFSLFAVPTFLLSPEEGGFFVQSLVVYSLAIFLLQFVFGMMGAAVFKNHVELNYSVRSTRRSELRNMKQEPMIEVDIYIQEGRFEDAIKSLWKLVETNKPYSAYEKLISIYHFQGEKSFYQKVAQQYFEALDRAENYTRASEYYSKMQSQGIDFKPESEKLAVAIANQMKNPRQAKLAIKLLMNYRHTPNSNSHWENVCLCLAQLEFEFNQDKRKALELIDTILKRAVDQSILESAANYKRVIESY